MKGGVYMVLVEKRVRLKKSPRDKMRTKLEHIRIKIEEGMLKNAADKARRQARNRVLREWR